MTKKNLYTNNILNEYNKKIFHNMQAIMIMD